MDTEVIDVYGIKHDKDHTYKLRGYSGNTLELIWINKLTRHHNEIGYKHHKRTETWNFGNNICSSMCCSNALILKVNRSLMGTKINKSALVLAY